MNRALGCVKREYADDVGADAEKSRVAQAHHGAEAEQQIQTDGGDGVNEDAAEQRNHERLVGEARQQR